jgi:hypothetical protein
MTCKPSLFHHVVDELNRVLDEAKNDTTSNNVETNANVIMNDDEKMKNTTFDMTMVAGSSLGKVIVALLNEKKKKMEVIRNYCQVDFGNNKAISPSSQSVLTNFCAGNMMVTLLNT